MGMNLNDLENILAQKTYDCVINARGSFDGLFTYNLPQIIMYVVGSELGIYNELGTFTVTHENILPIAKKVARLAGSSPEFVRDMKVEHLNLPDNYINYGTEGDRP